MVKSFRDSSREAWQPAEGYTISHEQIQIGCLQRIADATELMAKRHQELIAQKESAERNRDYWRVEADRMTRRTNALKGQITKLKAQLAIAKATGEQA